MEQREADAGMGGFTVDGRGYRASKRVKRKLEGIPFTAVFCSTSGRALKTAETLTERRNIDITREPDLREINLGAWEGRKFDELEKESPDNFRRFWEEPQEYVPNHGESVEEVQNRGTEVVSRIAEEYPDGDVLIVSHSCILKSIILEYQERPLEGLWEPPHIYPAGLTILDTKTERLIFH